MRPRVLIVDDQRDIRKLISMTLDLGNVDVFEAENGEAALKMMHRVNPTVVLMDIMMPGEIDGLEACRRIKADPAFADTRVVMLTARGQQSDVDAGKAAGAEAYLVKPFSPLQLLDTVDRLTKKNGRAFIFST